MAEYWTRSCRNHSASRDREIQRLRGAEPWCKVLISNYTFLWRNDYSYYSCLCNSRYATTMKWNVSFKNPWSLPKSFVNSIYNHHGNSSRITEKFGPRSRLRSRLTKNKKKKKRRNEWIVEWISKWRFLLFSHIVSSLFFFCMFFLKTNYV